MKVIYPAIFHHENNSYWVEFPNLEGCQSFGDTIEETLSNAKEALAAYCVTLLEQGKKLTIPSNIETIQAPKHAFSSLVEAELITKSQSIKKTLTIPAWLNVAAEAKGINFSGTLQNALIHELDLIEHLDSSDNRI